MIGNRILHVSKTGTGGRFIGFQVSYLARLGYDIHLAVPGNGPLLTMAQEAGVEVHCEPALAASNLWAAGQPIARLLTSLRPALVHTHFVKSTMAARLARLAVRMPVPNLFQVPGPLHLENPVTRRADIQTARPFDHWGAACQWTFGRYLASGVSARRVHLTYYGKNLADYATPVTDREELRARLGIRPTEFVATMVSHVYPPRRGRRRGVKGHEDFIEAIANVRRSYPHVRGLIVGGPVAGAERYYRQLMDRATAVAGDGILFTGPRQDVADLYRASDVAVHPSLSENIGGAGESLLLRVPTITTTVGGFPDVVRPGVSGHMVAPRAPRDLAHAIADLHDDPARARRMADKGRAFALEVGDARRNAERVAEVYAAMGAL